MAQIRTIADIEAMEATPLADRILDKLPLTAVGKLYKPALIFEQIGKVFQAELQAIAGIADSDIRLKVTRG
jgi:hypothetical protein